MLKIFTSYFYQIRFFKPYQIPLSTALWDPKWFHDYKTQDHCFIDKNGVLNGLRAESLHPGHECEGLCHGNPCSYHPDTCGFLEAYSRQLHSLDMQVFQKNLIALGDRIRQTLKFSEDPEIMLIVHESPTNACSERKILQEVFSCREWARSLQTS